ncbi:MAG: division/cell wall cluster transcriptional repressor MraZ [Sphingomonadales bacterium]|nr:MAG: division/cell wall cluster transcriptional repressor MraZ [Sphingomonadales bacterium]
MADRELFEGFALQAVDQKGRVAIPADLRAAAERNSEARQIVISSHPFDPCLSAHDSGWSREKFERIDDPELVPGDPSQRGNARAKRRAFGLVEKAPFDESGRFVIPPFFKKKAGIEKWALFYGSGETFEIWSPEVLMKTADIDPELREVCEYLCDTKGVKL